jgi:hypothetical protein
MQGREQKESLPLDCSLPTIQMLFAIMKVKEKQKIYGIVQKVGQECVIASRV